MQTKRILLGISGGIAAYKSCELVRLLRQAGHEVRVVMSQAATGFVAPLTFQALSGHEVHVESHAGQGDAMAHIHLTRWADVMLIAPASMNTLAKINAGIADNLLSSLAAARRCPLALAPAMNVEMWRNPANQRNIAQLRQDGVMVFEPNVGVQACGETGEGRLPEAQELFDLLIDVWTKKTFAGQRVVLTAGATFEAIDPVRGITNLSSGRMGVALARAFRAAGAEVVLVHGQLNVPLPAGLAKIIRAESAQAMHKAVMAECETADVFVGVAAVADYRVANRSEQKLKKQNGIAPVIELTENPDILASVAEMGNAPLCVGFAAESENVLDYARQKRIKKNVAVMAANAVSLAMGGARNQITLISEAEEVALPESDKDAAAQAMVQQLAKWLEEGVIG